VKRIGSGLAVMVAFAFGAAMMRYYDTHQSTRQETKPTAAAPAAMPAGSPVHPPVANIHFDREPLWAYGFTDAPGPGDKASPQAPPSSVPRPNEDLTEQTRPRHVEGSSAAYSLVQIRDAQHVIDWFPGDHPTMPEIVAHGPQALGDRARGCGSCHLPNGRGRPENAPTGGLPAAYVIRQLEDFRHGLRYTADPRKPNTNTMIELARAMTDAEVKAAAAYFSSIVPPATPWVRVVESKTAPAVRYVGNLALSAKGKGLEPIRGGIVEMPEDEELAETLRSPHSGFVAYVPEGSIRKGEDLVTTGGMTIVGGKIVQGKTTACTTCHGQNLTGVVDADVPPIAGGSPSYLIRQLWDIQQGTRNGAQAQLMKLVVANLTGEDLVAIAAYVASRPPSAPMTAAPHTTN
jgi:cytochrome c553